MIFEFGKYILDVDVEKTRDFYNRVEKITDGCDCAGCRNYEKWAISTDNKIKHVFYQMGAQIEKATEVYVNWVNKDESVFYGGFYHLCGKILQGCQVWDEINEKHCVLNEDVFLELGDNYRVAFTEDILLIEENFPMPVIQIEILANIPWVLSEECDYYRCQ